MTENSGPKIASDSADDNAGHRARLRDRMLGRGGEALSDHELIEYLLALAIPRRDTKPLAKALLREFGGIGPLMSADPESLTRVSGMGEASAAAVKIAHACALRTLLGEVQNRPILGNWQGLLDYLRADMAFRINERVRVLHLDSRNHLIRDEVVSDGSIDQSAIYVREVVRRALDLGSAAIILVHNHPSGDANPSKQDIALTREIADACKRLGIALHDHIIIGRTGHVSLRTQGLI
ncbi:MAG: DNA repair protein RadC [Sphingopyxis sp.]